MYSSSSFDSLLSTSNRELTREKEEMSMAGDGSAAVPHVLLFPFPLQGHVPPMLKLAELISDAGLYVTFVNTENIHGRFLRASSPAFKRLAERPMFRFRTIPDGLPEDDPRPILQLLELEVSLRARSREPYRELLAPAGGRDPDGWPPVSSVIADGLLRLALEVAEEVDVPVMLLRTSSACSVWAYYSIPELIERGEVPFPEEAEMDELMQGVKGMESFLRRRDLPGLLRTAKSASDLQYLINVSSNLRRGRALILNTVEQLEASVLSRLRSVCPVIYTVGPLQLLHRRMNAKGSNAQPPTGGVSLWREDRSCMAWLDRQPHKSVVYVSFGSITVMSQEAVVEFWHGLVSSGHPFLWVIRPDMIGGVVVDGNQIVPGETTEKRCIVAWAPQEEVLAHPAVGCFLTHSGWNSTLESIAAGVPMVCWPFFADQQINSRFISEVWELGVDMKDLCGRSDVERMVRSVMDGEGAEKFRRTVSEAAEMVKMSAEGGGSSDMNLQKLIQHIRSFSVRGL